MMLEMCGEGDLLHMRKELRVGKTLRFNFLRQEPVTSFFQVSPITLSFQTRPPNSTTNWEAITQHRNWGQLSISHPSELLKELKQRRKTSLMLPLTVAVQHWPYCSSADSCMPVHQRLLKVLWLKWKLEASQWLLLSSNTFSFHFQISVFGNPPALQLMYHYTEPRLPPPISFFFTITSAMSPLSCLTTSGRLNAAWLLPLQQAQCHRIVRVPIITDIFLGLMASRD